jgi:hypothetical protein
MSEQKQSLEVRFDQHFKAREKLDKKYWEESERLTDEYEELMKELNES